MPRWRDRAWPGRSAPGAPPARYHGSPASPAPPADPGLPAFHRLTPHVVALTTDDEVDAFLAAARPNVTSFVNWSSAWCAHCQRMYPHYCEEAEGAGRRRAPRARFAVAKVDAMLRAAADVSATPTISVYKGRVKVDQFFGRDPERLGDHVWLWTD